MIQLYMYTNLAIYDTNSPEVVRNLQALWRCHAEGSPKASPPSSSPHLGGNDYGK